MAGGSLPPVATYRGLITAKSLTAIEFNSRKSLRGPLVLEERMVLYQSKMARVRQESQRVKRVESSKALSFYRRGEVS
jgi:hypothetical protein